MIFHNEFFELQFAFAERVSAVAGISLKRALFEYTNFYVRFGFGRECDETHEGWREYLDGLEAATDPLDWTYRFYLMDAEAKTAQPVVTTVGCFSYVLQARDLVRLHFQNAETSGQSPLHHTRYEQRRAELEALFADVKRNFGGSVQVTGTSWLYNLEAYRRIVVGFLKRLCGQE